MWTYCFATKMKLYYFTETNHLDQAKIALQNYASTFIITQGGDGSLVYNGKEFKHIPAYPSIVIDTVGAGDVFAGAFLYSILHQYNYWDAADFANYAASKIVSKFGARLKQTEIDEVRIMIKEAV